MPSIVGERKALDQMLPLARRHCETDPFRMCRETDRVDDEHFSFPTANRMALQRRLEILRVLRAEMHDALGVDPVDVEHDCRRVDPHASRDRIHHQHRSSGRNAIRMSREASTPCLEQPLPSVVRQRP